MSTVAGVCSERRGCAKSFCVVMSKITKIAASLACNGTRADTSTLNLLDIGDGVVALGLGVFSSRRPRSRCESPAALVKMV